MKDGFDSIEEAKLSVGVEVKKRRDALTQAFRTLTQAKTTLQLLEAGLQLEYRVTPPPGIVKVTEAVVDAAITTNDARVKAKKALDEAEVEHFGAKLEYDTAMGYISLLSSIETKA